MNINFEDLYLKSPLFIQNLAVQISGFKVNHSQKSGRYKSFLKEISGNLLMSKEKMVDYQTEKLKQIINLSFNQVPYYQDLFKKHGISSADIKTLEDLKKIPLLEKETLRKNPDLLLNQQYRRRSLMRLHTSGTTGTPLTIFCDQRTRQLNYAFFDRFLQLVGVDPHGNRATLGGRTIVSPHQQKPPFWRYVYFQNNLLLSAYHLTEENLDSYLKKLCQYKPAYIDAYPTSLYVLAEYAFNNNIKLTGITKAIITSAEMLQQFHREMIEKVFEAPIYDQYGCAEMCVFVAQCPSGNYHIHSDFGILEFLNSSGDPAAPGEVAEIVCTSLINPVMPLIRYRIGDLGILSDKKCGCSLSFPILEELSGRIDDMIYTPDGKKISRLGRVIYDFPIKEIQYIQKEIASVQVLIVKDTSFNENDEQRLIKELRKRLGMVIALQIDYVNTIERSANNKFKTVVSYLGNDSLNKNLN
jgi:phenylacetate-CoA ligase